jgi:enoyl-CoA hydratase
MFENLRYEVRENVLFLTVHRPRVLNALDRATVLELGEAVRLAAEDGAVRAVVLTGSGEKAFVAGADIAELARLSPLEARAAAETAHGVFDRIERLGKPVIAAVNGYALGGGCELAMACAFRIASETAVFGQPEVKLGLIPGFGGTRRLPRLAGSGRALEMLLTGEPIGAEEALRIGLVNRVVPGAELLGTAESVARKIAANAPGAVRLCLEAARRGEDAGAASLEVALFALCFSTRDMREGTRAFLEKRAAQFQGE